MEEFSQYRNDLARKLTFVKDRKKRREVLLEEETGSKYSEARKAGMVSRREKIAQKDATAEQARAKERVEFLKEIEVLKFKLEATVANINRLISIFFKGFTEESEDPNISIQSVTYEIERLKDKIVTGGEYIGRTAAILSSIRGLESKLEAEIKPREEKRQQDESALHARSAVLDKQLRNLKFQGFIKRGVDFLMRAVNRSEMKEIEQALKNLVAQVVVIKKERAQDEEALWKVTRLRGNNMEEKMFEQMQTELKSAENDISATLNDLWQKISNSQFFVEDVGNRYIEDTLVPVFDREIVEQKERDESGAWHSYGGTKITEELKNDYIRRLKKYLATGDEELRANLEKIASKFPSEVSRVCKPLLTNTSNPGRNNPTQIENSINSIFSDYAAEQVATVPRLMHEERQKMIEAVGPKIEKNFTIRKAAEHYYLQMSTHFSILPFDIRLSIEDGIRHDSRAIPKNMPLWSAARTTPNVRQAFAHTIDRLDAKYLESILDNSLVDTHGDTIEQLIYYPTPESVRNLVLLAAADFKNYRTVHASSVLSSLSKKPDWAEILDRAEERYPELKKLRPVLENFEVPRYQQQNPTLVLMVNDLSLSLIRSPTEKELVRGIAEQTISNEKILEILAEGGKFSADDIALFKQIEELEPEANYFFRDLLRRSFLAILRWSQGKEEEEIDVVARAEKMKDPEIKAFLLISKKAVELKGNQSAIYYLTTREVIEKVKEQSFKKDAIDIDLFLSSCQYLPKIETEVLSTYCEYFEGPQTVDFYIKLQAAYEGQSDTVRSSLAMLVGKKQLTPERVIELSKPIKTEEGMILFTSLNRQLMDMAFAHPEFFLSEKEGIVFLEHLNKKGIDDIGGFEYVLGQKTIGEGAYKTLSMNFKNRVDSLFTGEKPPVLDETNWKSLLTAYIAVMEEQYGWFYGAGNTLMSHADIIKKVFDSPEAKEICHSEMKKLWLGYLERGEFKDFPLSLSLINQCISRSGGAGPLSQIESFSVFTQAYALMLSKKTTASRTQKEVALGLLTSEKRFAKERWSNEETADFYNISGDIMEAAPSLFSAYFDIFEKLKKNDFRGFAKEIFPLHRVILSLLQKRQPNGSIAIDKKDLVEFRNYVRGTIDEKGELRDIETQRKELLEKILEMFKSKFGIIKIPQSLTHEHTRALTNISMYLSNMSDKDQLKENILSFYLALIVNDKWDDYRQGITIDPGEYLVADKAGGLKEYLENRDKLNPLTAANLGISEDQIPEFLKILEEESENIATGDVETVDVKLNSIISNLKGLEDLDLYPDKLDKKRMELLLQYGNKRIGAVSSKIYQSLTKPGRELNLSEEDMAIKAEIEGALKNNGLELNAENIKKYFQEEIKPLAVVANILHFVQEIGAEKEIGELRDILKPSDEIIAIFNKMGEEFKPTSGAIAISQDLEYLDNLIVKKSKELTEDEINKVKTYLAGIRQKLAKLEDINDLIKKKFANLKQGQVETKNELLRSKLEDISRIMDRPDSQHTISSTMTNNLPYIIENIRECLSCVRQGANNDTNLTFGDPNKFYLSSKSDINSKSISDQIVFVEPITFAEGSQEVSFVLDRLYGLSTPAILINQIETVFKKYKKIKAKFPGAKMSILVSSSAIQSGGMSGHLLIEKLKEKFGNKVHIEEVTGTEVDVVSSASGDHYIEFGGSARTDGKRTVNGVLIR